jgi:hypothetical protein
MFGLFNLFGRSRELEALDLALREAGPHPRTVPEAVKLTALRLLRDGGGAADAATARREAAELLAFCMLGRSQFVASNSLAAADSAEARLERAVAAGDGRDARLVLLAAHAGLLHPEIAERVEVESR